MSTDFAELFYSAKEKLHFDALSPADEELVDLSNARGNYKHQKLLAKLGIVLDSGLPDRTLNTSRYILFGGHIGCGKSTELRLLQQDLAREDRYFTLFIDIIDEMDPNSLNYSDLLVAIGKVLIEKLEKEAIPLEPEFLTPLLSWAKEIVNVETKSEIFNAELKGGAKGEVGLPFVGKIFSHFTSSIRNNSTYKTEVREVVQNCFSNLAGMFNTLIRHAEDQIKQANKGRKVLFIVDGTDRLTPNDAERFFSDGVMQLRQITSSFIYCTKNKFLDQDGRPAQLFDPVRIPMIKLNEKDGKVSDKHQPAWQAMGEFVSKRVSSEFFDSQQTIDFLIEHSGGHLRDLIRLLDNCVNNTFGAQQIDMTIAEESVAELATEYRRLLEPTDYQVLVEIDLDKENNTPRTDASRRLLENLVLLEYNSYWWRSHPLIRTLPGYKKAEQEYLKKSDSNESP